MSREESVPGLAAATRAYRFLWLLYPAEFREQHGPDATELFRDRYRAEYDRLGIGGICAFWLRTTLNVLRHGPAERLATRFGRPSPASGALGGDVRFAFRALRASPGFTIGAATTLALGMGAAIALFSLIYGVLIRPLPYPEADRIVQLWEENRDLGRLKEGPSPWNFTDWERTAESFEGMAAWYLTSGTYRDENSTEETRSAQVTTSFFRVMGVAPKLGRDFLEREGASYGPVILSDRFWKRRFAGDPEVVGRTMELSGRRYEIVGVMPEGFDFPDPQVEYWLAWDFPSVYGTQPESRTWRFLRAVGRLTPAASMAEAEAELSAIHRELANDYPDANRGWTVAVTSLHDEIVGTARATLQLAMGAVVALLLLACANVANLLLARVPIRAGELAIRSALGAGRERLVRQLVIENLALAAIAGLAGFVLAAGFLEVIERFEAGRIPRLDEVRIDGWVLLFSVCLATLTSVFFGLAPMIRLVRDPSRTLRSVAKSRTATVGHDALRSSLVVAQVGLALVLLVGAGLFVQSFREVQRVDMGFEPQNALTFRLSLDARHQESEGDVARYYKGLLETLESLPGVVAAGASQTLPINPVGNDFSRPFREAGAATPPAEAPTVALRIVTPGYFNAVGMRLVRGESWSGDETFDDPLVAVVNQTLAGRLWPNSDPVGEVFEIDFRQGWQPYRVVGVVGDVRHAGPRNKPGDEVFLSHAQSPYLAMSVVLRADSDVAHLAPVARTAVLNHPPRQPAHNFVEFEDLLVAKTAPERFLALLMLIFAGVSACLAIGGVYGVVAYGVTARTREFGIRMALGAQTTRIVRGVVLGSARMAGFGVSLGVLAVLLLGGLVEAMLFEVSPVEPVRITVLSVGLLMVATGAAFLSARKVAAVDPAGSLRRD